MHLTTAALALVLFLSAAGTGPFAAHALSWDPLTTWLPTTMEASEAMYRWWNGRWELNVWTVEGCEGGSFSIITMPGAMEMCYNLDDVVSLRTFRGGRCITTYYKGANCSDDGFVMAEPECGRVIWKDTWYTLTKEPYCYGWQEGHTVGSVHVQCPEGWGNRDDGKIIQPQPQNCRRYYGNWPWSVEWN